MNRFFLLSLLFLAKSMWGQVSDTTLWIPNGPVNALVLKDSLLYVGGNFTQVSRPTGHFLKLDSTTANFDMPVLGVNGRINCMARDSSGYTYVGGAFTEVGNFPCANLFRLTPQGNYDPTFQPNPDGEVFTILIYDTTMWVGGDFQNISSEARGRIAQYDSSRTLTQFNANANGPVYALAYSIFYNTLVVGGNFNYIAGHTTAFLARLDPNSGAYYLINSTIPWSAVPLANGPVRDINTLANRVYVAGDFTAFGNLQRKGMALLDMASGTVKPNIAGINGTVRDIERIGYNLYIGGNFSVVDGQTRHNLACVDTALNVLAWDPSANGPVYELQPWADLNSHTHKFCVGGDFSILGSDSALFAGIVDLSGSAHPWNAKLDGPVYAMMPSWTGGAVLAGGDFTGAQGVFRKNLCAININTKIPTGWNPSPDNEVDLMYAGTSQLFIAGLFSSVSNAARAHIASFDFASGTLTPFNPGTDGTIRTMAQRNSQLFIGGNFATAGGQQRANLACIDIGTSLATIWNPGCAGTVNKLIVDGDHLYVGGFFSQTGGQARQNLARIGATNAVTDLTWSCDADNGIYDMELYNGNLYVCGWFQQVDGQPRNFLAAMDTTSGNVLPFNPGAGTYVRSMTRYNDDLFFSGPFNTLGGNLARPRLANFDIGDGLYDAWAPAPDVAPTAMAVSQNWLFIGGSFLTVTHRYHPNLAMISVNWLTDVPENNAQQPEAHAWPNPAVNSVFVQTPFHVDENYSVQLIDVNGKTVLEGNYSGNFISIDLSGMAAGMYTLRMTNENGAVASTRIVKAE